MRRYGLFALLLASLGVARLSAADWSPLFNGRDLTGWRAWLGRPPADLDIPDLPRDTKGKYTEALGYDRDTYNVFSVATIDGAPVIRISGRIGGGLTSDKSYGNYRLRLRYKWGAPPAKGRSNSGIVYHVTGDPTLAQPWGSGHEFQARVGEAGDYWCQGQALADIPARPLREKDYVYDPAAPAVTFANQAPIPRHCAKSATPESPPNEWTALELVCYEGQSAQLVNGQVVLRISRSQRQTPAGPVPMNSGRLMLQSEGGEVFIRDLEIEPLTKRPAELPVP